MKLYLTSKPVLFAFGRCFIHIYFYNLIKKTQFELVLAYKEDVLLVLIRFISVINDLRLT